MRNYFIMALLISLVLIGCDIPEIVYIMKGVGIEIPQKDFTEIKNAGFDIITTEWGMEEKPADVKSFLDRANEAGLKVVMDGGFSYTAWGFTDDDWDVLPRGKRPVWQKKKVQDWIKAFKDHPAVIAWDICNEWGENLPSGEVGANTGWPKTAITNDQLRQAKADIREIDPVKPLAIRIYDLDINGEKTNSGQSFQTGIADIVMLNFYSNYLENNHIQWADIIHDIGSDYVNEIRSRDAHIKIWISTSTHEEAGIFKRPTTADLNRDITECLEIPNIDGMAFFAWGPLYPDSTGKTWYLPQSAPDLWKTIQQRVKESKSVLK
jgi:hypothetical protein